MESAEPTALPWGNPVFVIGVVIVTAFCLVLFAALKRFDRWASSRGLRWHWMGGDAWYLWPEGDRPTGRSGLALAALSLVAVLLAALALSMFLVVSGR
jgi:hypothetical protein